MASPFDVQPEKSVSSDSESSITVCLKPKTHSDRRYEQEHQALEERKKTDALLKERAEERQMEELQQMEEAASGTQRKHRVEWMYAGPAAGDKGTTEEMEKYLLGSKRLDSLIQKEVKEKKSVPNEGAVSVGGMGMPALNTRDIAAKASQDPLLEIKSQELSIMQAALRGEERAAKRRAEQDARRDRERRHRHHRRHERERSRSRSPRRRSDRDDHDRSRRSHRRHRHRSQSYSR